MRQNDQIGPLDNDEDGCKKPATRRPVCGTKSEAPQGASVWCGSGGQEPSEAFAVDWAGFEYGALIS